MNVTLRSTTSIATKFARATTAISTDEPSDALSGFSLSCPQCGQRLA